MSTLELVPTDDLIEELLNRIEHGMIVLMRPGYKEWGEIGIIRRWRGNSHTIMGLCLDAANIVGTDLVSRSSPTDKDT